MAKGDDLQDRLIQFAARIIKVSNALPPTIAGRHIAGQLLRSGTAPAAHHSEARAAESPSDFIHKMKIGVKEVNYHPQRGWLDRAAPGRCVLTESLVGC
ncbi:MAG TPA: four helix bundle protein [Anaerolineae bacterium]|nr:four helix bundle protein [Anaerolineae bacterium]